MSIEEETEYSAPPVENNGKQSILTKMSDMLRVSRPALSLPKQGFFSPLPPTYSPKVEEQLQVDLMESERLIQLLQAEITMVREKLNLKEDDLLTEQNDFRKKGQRLTKELNEATRLVTETQDQLTAGLNEQQQQEQEQQQQQQQQQERETKLLNEIQLLSDQLDEKTTEYMAALETLRTLKESLAKAQAALEEEQMQSKTEKEALEASIQKEKMAMIEMKDKLDVKEKSFQTLQNDLRSQVEKGNHKLEGVQAAWSETKAKLQDIEAKLQSALLENKDIVEQSSKKLKAEKEKVQTELDKLQQRHALEQNSTQTAQSALEKERDAFDDAIEKLTSKVKKGESVISELGKKLLEVEEKFEMELAALEAKRLQEAEEASLRIQKEAASKKDGSLKEMKQLEKELAAMKKVHNEAMEKRNNESDEMRRELMEQKDSAASEAKEQEALVKDSYDKKLADNQAKAKLLEEELCKVKLENEELSVSLCDAQREKDQSIEEAKSVQTKHDESLSDYEMFEERISLLDTEFLDMKATKEELEVTLNQVNLEKEEAALKAQEVEANYTTQQGKHVAPDQAEQLEREADTDNNFHWAIDRH